MDLVAFMRVPYDEAEAHARTWRAALDAGIEVPAKVAMSFGVVDPDKVLADVDAKRRIVEEHAPKVVGVFGWGEDAPMQERKILACRRCGTATEYPVEHPCLTLRLLALAAADHPDYDERWRPTT